ncbi:MAG: PEP-CTERM sorting domain-containing protein [Planctomycetota bacterium]
MNRTRCIVAASAALSPFVLAPAAAQTGPAGLYLSVADNVGTEIVQGPYTDEDVILTDAAGSSSSLFFSIDAGDLDAFHILPNGNYLLSSLFNGVVGADNFQDADLVEYDPVAGSVVGNYLGLGEGSFTSTAADVDAATTDAAGNLYFSALGSVNVLTHTGGSLTFTDGDIVRLDAATGVASIFVTEGDLFDDGDGDVYGLHWNGDGTLLVTTNEDESISGSSFLDGDVFIYDPALDTASPFFSESSFTSTNTHDVDAVYFVVPAPASAALLGLGGLTALRRRR